jgi:hypothetical protein
MRGYNLFVDMGSQEPLNQIKLKSHASYFKPLLSGTSEAIINYEL